MGKALFVAGIIILMVSCINTKKLINNYSIDRIYFGKSGGFTNIPMEYVLFEKGQLYKMKNDSLVKIRKISRKQLETIDSLLADLDFKQLSINEPGNITYFIKVVKREYEKEVNWSDSSDDNILKELYNILLATIKK